MEERVRRGGKSVGRGRRFSPIQYKGREREREGKGRRLYSLPPPSVGKQTEGGRHEGGGRVCEAGRTRLRCTPARKQTGYSLEHPSEISQTG